jgi:hypothetical protein
VSLQKSLIACLAHKRLGKLLQEAIYELQAQFSLIEYVTLTCHADAGGAAGNKTIVGTGLATFTALLGAGWTATVGGAEVVGKGVSVVVAGGVNAIPAVAAQFDGQVAGMAADVTIDADVAGVAGNVTLVAAPLTDITALIAAWNMVNPANTLTLAVGDGSQVPTANIVLSGGTALIPAVAASFSGVKAVVGTTVLVEPLFI